jgi:L-tartrate/succinate antiporter
MDGGQRESPRAGVALWRAGVPLLVGIGLAALPVPTGLGADAWRYFAIFGAVIAALVTEPIPGPAVGAIGVTLACVLRLVAPTPVESLRWALAGFSDSTVWLMFLAFMLALGYQKTGLGRRIALFLVHRLGGRALGLGYAIALTELVLAPFVPSNTARSGGIVFPLIESIPGLYGSAPGATAGRMGAYVMWTAFATMCVTSSMFVTALAPNLLAVAFMQRIAGVEVTWAGWLLGFLPMGLLLLALQPLLIYRLCPPTVTVSTEVPEWARRQLAAMGTLSRREVTMGALALTALALWVLAAPWIHPTAVALLIFSLMLVTRVIDWDDVLGNRRAWSYLVWFATLVTLADGLNRAGFLSWFATVTADAVAGWPTMAQIAGLVGVFFVSHYMFASLTAHATALLPVVLTAAVAIPGMPVAVVSLALSYALGLMGILTPYATGAAPLYVSSGYFSPRRFWTLGGLFGLLYLALLLGVELPYLRFLHP